MVLDLYKPQKRKKFLRESLSISAFKRKIITNPEKPVDDCLRLKILILLSGALICYIFNIVMRMDIGIVSMVCGFIDGFLVAIYSFHLINLITMIKVIYSKKSADHSSTIALEKHGVFLVNSFQAIEVFWSSVKCIKRCKYAAVVVPKDYKTQLIVFPIENLERIEKFLEENEIEIKTI